MQKIFILQCDGRIMFVSNRMVAVWNALNDNVPQVDHDKLRSYQQFTRYFYKMAVYRLVTSFGENVTVTRLNVPTEYNRDKWIRDNNFLYSTVQPGA